MNDLLRRRQVVTWSSVDLWEEERTAEYPAVQGDDPAEQVSEDDCVRAALGQLSDGYRQALLLHAYQGYNGEQIARAIGIAPSGGKMYLSRARKRFQRFYEEHHGI